LQPLKTGHVKGSKTTARLHLLVVSSFLISAIVQSRAPTLSQKVRAS
jgi:hypothetical protein